MKNRRRGVNPRKMMPGTRNTKEARAQAWARAMNKVERAAKDKENGLPYAGKDGLERNWLRAKYEWGLLRRHVFTKDTLWNNKSHDPYTNFFVESRRAAPWLVGHLDSWAYPTMLTIIFWDDLVALWSRI